ncbi:SDR family oxidoreductase [Ahrensia sp. R2A130]|uniref:SDR family oxidoreductase n=1 Tax=Ahrensia sp. R2A130 TaxID=744979 RepID=UPI0001E0D7F7|nr:SDR family oxidoreductase [Ahrensia sp. R2A130]EFL90311.1 serine 3-dehydrogenase [Ahrensia sp. R2A130]
MSKNILITGASSGIGAACARHAVKAGHKVALAARSKDKLEALVAELGSDNAVAISCDVTKPDDQRAMFKAASDTFGPLDVVFANAGLGASVSGNLDEDIPQFETMIMVNCFGMTVTAKLAQEHMKTRGGHLVLTGSRAAHVTIPGSVYASTKWYVDGFARMMFEQTKDTGVRVTNIEPGMVDTPFFDSEKPDALRPDDIANAFIYAISQPDTVNVMSMEVYPTPKS